MEKIQGHENRCICWKCNNCECWNYIMGEQFDTMNETFDETCDNCETEYLIVNE